MNLCDSPRSHYLFALLTLIPIIPCHAEEPPPTVTVRVADLNLQSTLGKATLLWRIEAAATAACSSSQDKALVLVIQHKRCRNEAIADAIAKLHSPDFAAYYAEHSHQSPALTFTTAARAHETVHAATSQE